MNIHAIKTILYSTSPGQTDSSSHKIWEAIVLKQSTRLTTFFKGMTAKFLYIIRRQGFMTSTSVGLRLANVRKSDARV